VQVKRHFRRCRRNISKSNQIDPPDQLLLEDVRYLNEKRGLELQKFRLRSKMEELKLSSTQAANYFLLESINAYAEFLDQAPALLPSKAVFEGTKSILQKHDEEMAARLNVCDSVQAELEVEIDAASLISKQFFLMFVDTIS